MIIDPRVAALNEAAVACQELAAHYEEDLPEAGDPALKQRLNELDKSQRLLDAEVNRLGELPKAADPDKESLDQLLDDGKAALANFTGGALGQTYTESLAGREQQLQQVLREVLSQPFDTPLSCEASDVLEAAVVESERAQRRLSAD